MVDKVEFARNLARENIQVHQEKYKAYYDQKAKQPDYKVGDQVWLNKPITGKGLSPKLIHHWHSPYVITSQPSDVHAMLKNIDTEQIMKVPVHVNHLKMA